MSPIVLLLNLVVVASVYVIYRRRFTPKKVEISNKTKLLLPTAYIELNQLIQALEENDLAWKVLHNNDLDGLAIQLNRPGLVLVYYRSSIFELPREKLTYTLNGKVYTITFVRSVLSEVKLGDAKLNPSQQQILLLNDIIDTIRKYLVDL